jgi:hypothetical protein
MRGPAIENVLRLARRYAAGGPLLSEDLDRDLQDAVREAFGRPPPSDLDNYMRFLLDRSIRTVPPTGIPLPVPNTANVDPIARPPGTVERIEDIEMQEGGPIELPEIQVKPDQPQMVSEEDVERARMDEEARQAQPRQGGMWPRAWHAISDLGETVPRAAELMGTSEGRQKLYDAAAKKWAEISEAYGPNLPRHIYEGIKPLVTAPGEAVEKGTTSEQAVPWAVGTTATLMGQAPFAAEGSIGVFGGKGSPLANLSALKRAEKMQAAGYGDEAIWNNTGWGWNASGDPFFHIPMNKAEVSPGMPRHPIFPEKMWLPDNATASLPAVLQDPTLYKHYPFLKDYKVIGMNSLDPNASNVGMHWGDKKMIGVAPDVPEEFRKTLIHEVDHAIQQHEGFPGGGTYTRFLPQGFQEEYEAIRSQRKEFNQAIKSSGAKPSDVWGSIVNAWHDPSAVTEAQVPFLKAVLNSGRYQDMLDFLEKEDRYMTMEEAAKDNYYRLAGEVSARNAEFRSRLTPEESRAITPWASQQMMQHPIPRGEEIRHPSEAPSIEPAASLKEPQSPYDLDPNAVAKWEKVGGQKGSNPGGTYQDPEGNKWYVKTPKTPRQAQEEILAGKFYKMLGVPSANTQLTAMNGKLAVASQIIPDVEELNKFNPKWGTGEHPWAYVKDLREHFPADAWLANWDAIGLNKENVLVDPVTKQGYRIDQGGALSYRAKGEPKGEKFGNTVGELDEMRKPVYTAGEVFGGIKPYPDPANLTAQRIAALKDEDIRNLVERYLGNGDPLADKLIARRDDLADKYGLTGPAKSPEAETLAALEKALGYYPPPPPSAGGPGLLEKMAGDEDLISKLQAAIGRGPAHISPTTGLPDQLPVMPKLDAAEKAALPVPKLMNINKTYTTGQIVQGIKSIDLATASVSPKIITEKQVNKIAKLISETPSPALAAEMSKLSKPEQANVKTWLSVNQFAPVSKALGALEKGGSKYTAEDIAQYYDNQHEHEQYVYEMGQGIEKPTSKPSKKSFVPQSIHDAIEPLKVPWSEYKPPGSKGKKLTQSDIPNADFDTLKKQYGFGPLELWHGTSSGKSGEYFEIHDPATFLNKTYQSEKALFLSHDKSIPQWKYGSNLLNFIARPKKVGIVDYPEAKYPGQGKTSASYSGSTMANLTKAGHADGYDMLVVHNISDMGGIQTQYLVLNKNILRSPKAKFSPAMINTGHPLSGLAGFGVGLGAAGAGYGMLRRQDQQNQARGGKVKPPVDTAAIRRLLMRDHHAR